MTMDPLFIVGSERSGTTMLRLMLNEHSGLFIPSESHFLETLVRNFPKSRALTPEELDQAFSIIVNSRRWQDWNEDPDLLREYLNHYSEQTLAQLIDRVFRFCKDCDATMRWGDKTPKYVYSIHEISQIYPKAKFIHIVRDGRDVCVSMLNTKWLGSSIRQIAEHWCSATRAAREAESILDEESYLQIRYEDLVRNNETVLKAVCEFIGEDYQPEILDFYKNTEGKVADRSLKYHKKTAKQPSSADTNRWRKELPLSKVLVYEAHAAPQLVENGYHLRFSGLLRIFPWMVSGVFRVAEITLPLRSRLGIHFPRISRNF